MGIMTEFAGNYARIKVVGVDYSRERKQIDLLAEFVNNNSHFINIACCSSTPTAYTQERYWNEIFKQRFIDVASSSNTILFFASGNTKENGND